MAYIVKYIRDFSDVERIKQVCLDCTAKGYKIKVFSPAANHVEMAVQDTEFFFCDDAQVKAVETAQKLYAEKCMFYVKRAIYSVDPAVYPDAVKLSQLDYESAQELSVKGFNDVEYNALDLAKRASVRIEVLSLQDTEGTTIKEVAAMDGNVIKSMSKDPDIGVITLTETPDRVGVAYRICKVLGDSDIYVDSVMLSAPYHGRQEVGLCIKRQDVQQAREILLSQQQYLEFSDVSINENAAKIALIGAGFHTHKGVAAKILEVLYQNDINIMMIFTSEVKMSLVVEKSQADNVIRAIHKNLIAK